MWLCHFHLSLFLLLLFSPSFNPKSSLSGQVWRQVSLCDTQHICVYHLYLVSFFSLIFNSKKSLSGQVWRRVSLCDTQHLCLSSNSVVTVERLHCVESLVESTVLHWSSVQNQISVNKIRGRAITFIFLLHQHCMFRCGLHRLSN